ncbi:MAG: helix-turn-helix domain-containing protein, partial [Nocardioidaceae bacterium]
MDTDFAAIGRLLAAPARSSMLGLLFDGEEHVAGELAASAGVRASTASEHLAALVSGGLVTVRTGGRHRHYSLGSPAVAEALELLGHLCPTTEIRSLRQSRALTALASARTCYDHLAGRLGVDLLDSLVVKNWLRLEPLEITERGEAGLADLGIQLDELRLR